VARFGAISTFDGMPSASDALDGAEERVQTSGSISFRDEFLKIHS
jgi:hypothetical protein